MCMIIVWHFHGSAKHSAVIFSGPKPGMTEKVDKALEFVQQFNRECLRLGSLTTFKHFSVYLRGREELLITIRPVEEKAFVSPKSALVFATPFKNVVSSTPIPPASPVVRETLQSNPDETIFLIAAYSRYKAPFVWVRKPGDVPVELRSKIDSIQPVNDSPLQLATTGAWSAYIAGTGPSVRIWDVVSELVMMNSQPSPINPLQVDRSSILAMSPTERTMHCAALASFLRDVLLSGNNSVLDDLQFVIDQHYRSIPQALSRNVQS